MSVIYMMHPSEYRLIRDIHGDIWRYPSGLILPDGSAEIFMDTYGQEVCPGGKLNPRYWAVQRYPLTKYSG